VALERGKGRHFFLSGLLFGLAYLIKPEALSYVLLLSLIVGVVGFARRMGGRWVASSAALVCVGALLAAAPYVYYLRNETGRWTLTEKFGANLPGDAGLRKLLPGGQLTTVDILFAGTRSEPPSRVPGVAVPVATEPASGRPAPAAPKRTFLGSLKAHVKHTLKGLYINYGVINQLLPPLVLLLIGAGLFARAWRVDRLRLELYVCSFVFATLLGYSFTYQNLRFLVPLIPLALCWAAIGSTRTASWLSVTFARLMRGRLHRVRIGPRQALALVTSIVVLSVSVSAISRLDDDRWDPRPAADWIKSQGFESPLIMATGPWPTFYAGGRYLCIPNEELPVVLTYAKQKKIDFLVLEKRNLGVTPSLAPLLEGKNTPPELTLVYEYADSQGWVGVYRLSEAPGNG
jgi:hypothetical protein